MSLERLSQRASSNSIPDLQYLKSVSRVFEIEISVVDFLTISIEEKSHARRFFCLPGNLLFPRGSYPYSRER
ncbi:hypothetical protein DLM77_15990 [Leptospira yasudae]|uniref:Uncharacterized protein n=1 Tax=Leptospira yasudae TaxID=2202201 RepID=A0ABX9M008_9LEPT|nr:hypothetical protein DLM77_15990 [Leptospira yasudae]